jgi:hypothetical protein
VVREKFSDVQIADLVMALAGEVEPVGETHVDDQRFQNLCTLQNVVDILLDEIYFVTAYSDRYEYSMKRSAETAYSWMKEKKKWFNDIWELEGYDG